MKNLIQLLHVGGYSCVIMNNMEVRTFHRRGVADLYDLFQHDKHFLKGAIIADKVIGKAAAALIALSEVEKVYTDIISEPALKLLLDAGIKVEYLQSVPFIENRDKSGQCPLETRCADKSITEIVTVVQDFMEEMRLAIAV